MSGSQTAELVREWHNRWNSLVLRLLSQRLADRAEVQDLAQEVYLRLLRVETLDLVRNPSAYLYRVAMNVASEWQLRAPQRKPHTSEELEDLVSIQDPHRSLERKRTGDAVRKALLELPPVWRQVLVLHCGGDMTYDQIARRLGISRRMVKRYVAKGYAAMREHMQPILEDR